MNKLTGIFIALLLGGCAFIHSANTTDNNDAAVQEHPEQFLVVAVANAGDVIVRTGSIAHGYDASNVYGQSARARQLLQDIARDYQLQSVKSWPIQVLSMQCAVFKPVNNISVQATLVRLQHDSRVMLAQPLNSFATDTSPAHAENPVSHDSYASLQHSMQRMDVEDAHHWSRGRGVRIAVVDTGMDRTHPGLRGRISAFRNFVDDNQVQFNHDRHGTAVAGVIAANSYNGMGITGVAPDATLLALKACWQLQTDRDDARCNSFTLAQALTSAIELHAKIINLSVVGPTDPLLAALIKQAQNSGIIVVGAADADGLATFPAHLPDIIAVSAMEQVNRNTSTVNAPGQDVLTLVPGGKYDFRSGSSIATAEVSGAVALLIASGRKKLDSEHLTSLLLKSTETSSDDNYRSINACRALSVLLQQPGCKQTNMDASNTAIR